MKTKITNPFRGVTEKLRSIPGDPARVSYGYALGIFLAATPLIGLKVFLGIFLAYLFGLNRMACTIGVLHVNGVTGPLYYGLSFWLGKLICGYSIANPFYERLSFVAFKNLLLGNAQVFIALCVGGLIISIPGSLLALGVSKWILKKNNPKIK